MRRIPFFSNFKVLVKAVEIFRKSQLIWLYLQCSHLPQKGRNQIFLSCIFNHLCLKSRFCFHQRTEPLDFTTFNSVKEWLDAFKMGMYASSFTKAGYHDLNDVARMNEDELLNKVGVRLVGHRHKIYQRIKEMNEHMELSREKSIRIWKPSSEYIGNREKIWLCELCPKTSYANLPVLLYTFLRKHCYCQSSCCKTGLGREGGTKFNTGNNELERRNGNVQNKETGETIFLVVHQLGLRILVTRVS